MPENIRQVFMKPLEESGLATKQHHPYGKVGTCFSSIDEEYRTTYWMYQYEDMFTISVTDMQFHEDFTTTFPLTEFLSIYHYDSINGMELPSRQPIRQGKVATFVAEGEYYTAAYRSDAPVRGVSINITPAYYDSHLRRKLPGGYARLKDAFCAFNRQDSNNPELLMVMRQIQNCHITGSSAHLYYESKVNEAIVLVLTQVENATKTISCNPSDRHQLQDVERFLVRCHADHVCLAELAQIACMSTSKLKYMFKATYGCNISEYLCTLRLDHAKKLLQHDKGSISEIAECVGYRSAAAFTKMFKEKTGVLPKDYRRSATGM